MPKKIWTGLLVLVLAFAASTFGCQSTGGGNYSSSDGHAGHSH